MSYVVFDLEWNQAMPHAAVDRELTENLPFEVIEVGAVRLDREFRIEDTFYGRIRPVHYRRINPFIAKVTKQNTASLKKGDPFHTVEKRFRDFCGDDAIFLSWSPSDSFVWLQNVRHFLGDERTQPAIDLQMYFQMKIEPEMAGQQRSLESTLDLLSLDKPDDFHSALTDASGAASVLTYLNRQGMADGLDRYQSRVTTIPLVSRTLDVMPDGSLRAALAAQDTCCPHCSEPLETAPVKKGNRFKATRLTACPEHGIMREMLTRSKPDDPVRHTLKFMFVGAAFLPLKVNHKGRPQPDSEAKKTVLKSSRPLD